MLRTSHLAHTAVASLRRNGYAVLDNALTPALASTLLAEIKKLDGLGLMQKNSTVLVKNGVTNLLEKGSVVEAELTFDDLVRDLAPAFTRHIHEDSTLLDSLNRGIPGLAVNTQAVKLQHNLGLGGCFPLHFDTYRRLDTRAVTAVCYLNEDWRKEHGGEIRMYPFPLPPVEIEPLSGRMVLFASPTMLHRVLPAHHSRYCFTVWSSHDATRPPAAAPPISSDPWSRLLRAGVREHLCKLVYADEWARSVEESHDDSEARTQALDTHWQEVELIARALSGTLAEVDGDMTKLMDWHECGGPSHDHDMHAWATQLSSHVQWFP